MEEKRMSSARKTVETLKEVNNYRGQYDDTQGQKGKKIENPVKRGLSSNKFNPKERESIHTRASQVKKNSQARQSSLKGESGVNKEDKKFLAYPRRRSPVFSLYARDSGRSHQQKSKSTLNNVDEKFLPSAKRRSKVLSSSGRDSGPSDHQDSKSKMNNDDEKFLAFLQRRSTVFSLYGRDSGTSDHQDSKSKKNIEDEMLLAFPKRKSTSFSLHGRDSGPSDYHDSKITLSGEEEKFLAFPKRKSAVFNLSAIQSVPSAIQVKNEKRSANPQPHTKEQIPVNRTSKSCQARKANQNEQEKRRIQKKSMIKPSKAGQAKTAQTVKRK